LFVFALLETIFCIGFHPNAFATDSQAFKNFGIPLETTLSEFQIAAANFLLLGKHFAAISPVSKSNSRHWPKVFSHFASRQEMENCGSKKSENATNISQIQ